MKRNDVEELPVAELRGRLLRLPEVSTATGLSDSTMRRREELGTFPRRVKMSPRMVGWYGSEIHEWLKDPLRHYEKATASEEAPPRPRSGVRVSEAMLVSQAPTFDGEVADADQLRRHSVRVEDLALSSAGIYFLWRGDTVVYVGQTRIGFARVATHLADRRKSFDAVGFVRCAAEQLDIAERAYINAMLPEYNTDPITMAAKRRRPPIKGAR